MSEIIASHKSSGAALEYEDLNTFLNSTALNAGYTQEQMGLLEGQFLRTSFAVITSNQSLKGMSEATLDLANSARLAGEAQNQAMTASLNSTAINSSTNSVHEHGNAIRVLSNSYDTLKTTADIINTTKTIYDFSSALVGVTKTAFSASAAIGTLGTGMMGFSGPAAIVTGAITLGAMASAA